MIKAENGIEILKTVWGKQADGRWGIDGLKGLKLNPQEGSEDRKSVV